MTPIARDSELLPLIRREVKRRLLASPSFRALAQEKRDAIARDTVKAIHFIVGGADGNSRPSSVQFAGDSPVVRQLAQQQTPPPPEGETAGQRFAQSGAVAAEQGADVLGNLINRVDFPKFVAGLIDGVFNAIVASSIKQMEAYADLVANVAKSAEQYMKDNVTENNARDYLVDRYPHVFELDLLGDKPTLKPRRGLDENSLPDFQSDFGLDEKVSSLDDAVVEEKIVPAARRRIAMDRQQLLATMVMMGVNRLVVTNGQIEATCMFELDTRDEVKRRMQQTRTSDFKHTHEGRGFGIGVANSRSSSDSGDSSSSRLWFTRDRFTDSTNFKVSTTRSEDSDAKVDLHAKLGGKVNLSFKSDYFPMERMVDVLQINQIRGKSPAGKTVAGSSSPPPGGA